VKAIDTHAHLDHLENLDDQLKRAGEAGVEGIVAMSMDLASCRKNLEIYQKDGTPRIFLAMGMHPSEADLSDLEACARLIRDHTEILTAIGEVGLDFWYQSVREDLDKQEEQRVVFQTFLTLAKELDLPVAIHSRGAWKESLAMVKAAGVKRAEFHWYSGPLDVLEELLAEGYYVSATPSIATSPQAREAMLQAPIERTLIETDCPVYYRNKKTKEGFQAEPKDVFRTLKAYCALKNMEEEAALMILNQNARDFFGLPLFEKGGELFF